MISMGQEFLSACQPTFSRQRLASQREPFCTWAFKSSFLDSLASFPVFHEYVEYGRNYAKSDSTPY